MMTHAARTPQGELRGSPEPARPHIMSTRRAGFAVTPAPASYRGAQAKGFAGGVRMPTKIDMARFAKFCKDMGFIYQSSEIYGGINGFWDYGPLGVELKRNIKEAWWTDMVRCPPPGPDGQEIRMVGLDCSIIMNPKVWVASGHVGGFSDPMVDCKECRKRFRADKVHVGLYLNDSGQ